MTFAQALHVLEKPSRVVGGRKFPQGSPHTFPLQVSAVFLNRDLAMDVWLLSWVQPPTPLLLHFLILFQTAAMICFPLFL